MKSSSCREFVHTTKQTWRGPSVQNIFEMNNERNKELLPLLPNAIIPIRNKIRRGQLGFGAKRRAPQKAVGVWLSEVAKVQNARGRLDITK